MDRPKSRLRLSSAHNLLQLAIEAGNVGTWSWDFDDGSLEWDDLLLGWYDVPESQRHAGLSFDEWRSRIHPEDRPRVDANTTRLLESDTSVTQVFRVLRADGSVRWLASSGQVERDLTGWPVRMVGVNRDVTAEREHEQELRSLNQRLDVATRAGSVGIWAWDLADGSLEWDERLMDWFRVPEASRDARILYEFLRSRIHPEDLAATEVTLAEAIEHRRPFDHVTRIFRADGAVRMVHASGLLELDSEGRPIRMIGINRDVTERHELERSLQQARAQAEAANEAKSRFLAHMSHEIRTPAGAIVGYGDMLLDPHITAEETASAVRSIRGNGRHLLRILDDILDLAKVEAGKIVLDPDAYAPWQLMHEVQSLLGGRAQEQSILLECRALTPLPERVLIDPTRVRQVLINLVGNALKFTAAGGRVEIAMGAEGSRDGGPGTLTLAVADQGIGMTAEQLDRLFRPFEQADGSTTRRFGGTGLGLGISHGLVTQMGGSIRVRSTPDVGSTFTVTLPLQWPPGSPHTWIAPGALDVDPAAQVDRPSDAGVPLDPAARILLADDSPDNRRVIGYYLKKLGLERVTLVQDGHEALHAALRDRPDLVLMDMEMPEMDGFAAVRALRRAGFDRPIIALTAHAMQQDRDRTRAAGCDEHLAKPVDLATLTQTLARFLTPAGPPEPCHPPSGDAAGPLEPAPMSGEAGSQGLLPEGLEDGIDVFLPLIREYVATLPGQLRLLRDAQAAGDRAALAAGAHSLRGSGGRYRYPSLSRAAGDLEDAIRGGDSDATTVAARLEALARLVDRIVIGIQGLP